MRFSEILCQCCQCTGICDQYLDLLFLDILADFFQRIVSHVGDIHHDQIIFERFPLTDRIFSLYPRTELAALHSHTETVQFHTGDKVHIYTAHLVAIAEYRKRCSCRTTCTQAVQLSLFLAVVHKDLVIIFYKITFGHYRKILKFCPFRMIFIIRRVFFDIIQKNMDPAIHIFLCHTLNDLSFVYFF